MDYFTYTQKLDAFKRLAQLQATGTPREAANRLNLSERTIKRMASRLRQNGTPIFFDRGIQSYILPEFS
ncbi:hypothetical protein HZ996_06975 [Cryomorphaceae bacterium]|nr:hypothetical protein HZ996_06975 [Cryomorphaceae bacterium]